MNLIIMNGVHINAILLLFGFQGVHLMGVSWLVIIIIKKKLIFFEHLLCARNCAKYFTCFCLTPHLILRTTSRAKCYCLPPSYI